MDLFYYSGAYRPDYHNESLFAAAPVGERSQTAFRYERIREDLARRPEGKK